MIKSQWQPADDCKSVTPPRLHRTRIGTDDTIKLHRTEAAPARPLERVAEHGSCDTVTLSFWCRNVTAVRNVRAASALVGAQVIRPQDASADALGSDDPGELLIAENIRPMTW